MTFSIAARSDDGESWGVAVASKFLAVGCAVPAARAGVGAVATQAEANVAWKRVGLDLLRDGLSAQDALDRMVADYARAEHTQLGVVDANGASATHTGDKCFDWAGGVAAPGVAIQGNILTGPDVVHSMKQAWDASAEVPFARRLLTALAAGDTAGGDKRGRQSAALLVARAGAGYAGLDDIAVDLRVDDHQRPIDELLRLLDLHDLYLVASDDADKVPMTPELAEELEGLARKHGQVDFQAWVGSENYEMRVAEDNSWVDQRVLGIIRTK
jgi:uncharacterized Ntn-hydrolase superfamily protein